jgi:hypothetical protein
VRASGRILQQAIGRMLDASRIDFGHEKLRCDEFELPDLLAELRAGLPDTPDVAVSLARCHRSADLAHRRGEAAHHPAQSARERLQVYAARHDQHQHALEPPRRRDRDRRERYRVGIEPARSRRSSKRSARAAIAAISPPPASASASTSCNA